MRNTVVGEFYGQLNFTDSKDLVPGVPGDLLLVFKYFVEGITSWQRSMYEFVWVNVDPNAELWTAKDVPAGGVETDGSLYGRRFRDADYPGLVTIAPKLCTSGLHVLAATKIGGVPSDQQSIRPPKTPSNWRFLGQIVATWPVEEVAYPVYDHPEPVRMGDAAFEALRNGPGSGVLCLFLDERGSVQMHFSDG